MGEFYKNRSRPDGLAYYCKLCTKPMDKTSGRKWREGNRDTLRPMKNAQQKRAYERDPSKHRERQAAWEKRNAEKKRAHSAVKRALKSGRLIRPLRCERCPNVCKPQAHHADYSKPLEVEWLCTTCHGKESRKL